MKRLDYLSWEEFFISVAKVCAMRSKDPSTQVGAIIVNQLNQIISTGYNGFPRGIDDDQFPWEKNDDLAWHETKYPYVAHAELNAIVSSRTNLTNCDLYVTLFPCNECAKIIIQSGIRKVFYVEDKYKSTKEVVASKRMLEAAGILFKQLKDMQLQIKK